MKRLLLILIGIIFIVGCSFKLSTYESINYNRLETMMKNKESFILYIGSTNCSHCQNFKPTLEAVIKDYQVKVYYLDVVDFKDADYTKLEKITTFEGGTPTILFIKKGVTNLGSGYNKIIGEQNKEYVISKFKFNGYIK